MVFHSNTVDLEMDICTKLVAYAIYGFPFNTVDLAIDICRKMLVSTIYGFHSNTVDLANVQIRKFIYGFSLKYSSFSHCSIYQIIRFFHLWFFTLILYR